MTAVVPRQATLALLFTMMTLAACGGGGGDSSSSGAPPPSSGGSGGSTSQNPPPPSPGPSAPTDAQRTSAAQDTARNHALCTAIRPFYWEVGDSAGSKASASVGGTTYTADTEIHFASASKWVYGAYVVELRNGALTDADVKHLNFTSGYHSMGPLSCGSASTVDVCLNLGTNGLYTPATDGRFFYNGAHMQRHAHDHGLGGMNAGELTFEVKHVIGDFGFTYATPQPPGGLFGAPSAYARFLRDMLAGNLKLKAQLGTHAVCTNPTTCDTADSTPVPSEESWTYSLGHWVESDPAIGDGAYSSAGAFGFYPWIDAAKQYYGLVARQGFGDGEGYASARCGRLIRKAWATGEEQR
jgi:hypothetical protein